jgi:hypothetical protein
MKNWKYIAAIAALSAFGAPAFAQTGWFLECIDLTQDDPLDSYSDDYGTLSVGNELFQGHLGVSGTVTWGGGPGPCFVNGRTMDASGRFAFSVGPTGSVQSGFDDGLALTTGAPTDPVGDFCYGLVYKDDNTGANTALYGDGGLTVAFIGASNRYIQSLWSDADVSVSLRMRSVGDAVRMSWDITNLKTEEQQLGLGFGAFVGMRTSNGQVDSQPSLFGFANQANTDLGTNTGVPKITSDNFVGFTFVPTTRPARNERRYDSNNPKFPAYVDFMFGQTEAYGIRVQNQADESVKDASQAEVMEIGNFFGPVEGQLINNQMRFHVAGDQTGVAEEADILLTDTSFAQLYPVVPVPAGGTRTIVHYLRSTWSVASYLDPYSLILDAPRAVSAVNGGQDGLTPNPMTIRVYLDNQYAQLDKEITLSDLRFTLLLPPGLNLVNGEPQVKTINTLGPNGIGFVQWQVESDGKTFGNLPVSVRAEPTPGPAKTITANVLVASTPNLRVGQGVNAVGFPYTFADTSLNAILGLQNGTDYTAFRWDAETLSYTPVASPARGEGYFLVANSDEGTIALNGASTPQDAGQGGLLTTLESGWNLIANPYSYPIKLSDLLAVVEDDPAVPLTWIDLVNNGYVNSALAYYDRATNSYLYTEGNLDLIIPHQAYWIFVSTFKPLRLSWPPVYTPAVANSGRGKEVVDTPWVQTDKNWKLQLSARNSATVDAHNYVGVAPDKKKAEKLSLMKPPMAPNADLEVAIMDTVKGQPTRMAQSFIDHAGRKDWTVAVRSTKPGEVTLTWPNLGTLPKNVRFRLTDEAAGVTKDLRATSGYTFTMAQEGTRQFKLTLEIGGLTKPVIGNVLVAPAGKGPSSPVNVTYALSADAMVTVRILSTSGKEVFTLSRGRAESAGENTVTWLLRDSANRAVAPGTYQVEIMAETPAGERVRKIVPINVIR